MIRNPARPSRPDGISSTAWKGSRAARVSSERTEQVRRVRTHRLILPGDWVLALREKLEEIRNLMASEPAGFLEQGKMLERNRALMTEVHGQ
ncbi:MAG: hypothetical protein F4186_03515 [Boseongicola sp. SB0676_bin_33]|uniref:Uncharacterized protein n=1 Tax=Boseongicola sp. SB0664_bin_43 TaxID=2604844 RepID=A0A6B0XY74_9RHOB|nr:hypothetical protein [Boseongicola sp. SB0664_bin_43]MYF88509.1 hypothetical protein [Boseongicola sp. SB0676_bin_33]MYK31740.1 hypothetical protein [Boseongicola sp. SB0670_bin_30]